MQIPLVRPHLFIYFFEDLRIKHGSNVDILVCGSLEPVLIEENNKMHETQPVSVWLFNFNQL